LILVFDLQSPVSCFSVPSRMLTGLAIWIIDVARVVMLYFLVVISLPGVQENRLRSHDQARRLNIKLLLMLLSKLSEFKFCFVNLGFLCPDLPVYGVTILVQHISMSI
jgi:hypothetical protein